MTPDPATRAAERAARYETYSEHAQERADSANARRHAIADMIPFGQPILVGHHSESRARRDAERIMNLADKELEESKRAAYWKERAQTAVAHAARLERPDVVARRIKALEAEQRKCQRYNDATPHIHWQRWIDHLQMRLDYERALLVAVGGLLVDKPDTPKVEVGGAVQFLRTWYTVTRVNKKSVTIIGWMDIPTWTYLVPHDDITGVKSKAEWEAQNAKATGA